MSKTAELAKFPESLKTPSQSTQPTNTDAAKLQRFFQKIAPLLPSSSCETRQATKLNPIQLQEWLSGLKQPLLKAKQSGLGFNPWMVANIKRDEVRNSSILAWLLNPHGNHGLGALLLRSLLQGVPDHGFSIELDGSSRCMVRTESSPDGDSSNRVDIEIDADHFYLLIEVKIGAPEGTDQLSRYGALCEQRAGARPWAIFFLTPKRSKPKTAGRYENNIYCVSWLQVSKWLSGALKQHIAQRTSPDAQEILTRESIKCFLSYIRTF
jgi:hypothetical protein